MRIPTVWTNGLKDEETKQAFIQGLVSNPYLKLLRKIIEVRKEHRRRKSVSEEFFKEPQWAIRRAYNDGRDAELDTILDLLTFDPRSPNDA